MQGFVIIKDDWKNWKIYYSEFYKRRGKKLKKLITAITLCAFIFTSIMTTSSFAADEGPTRPTPGTAQTPAYEISSDEPEAVEAEEAPVATEEMTAEEIASSEAVNAYISGANLKIIEGAIFVAALVALAFAVSSDGDSAPPAAHGGHGD